MIANMLRRTKLSTLAILVMLTPLTTLAQKSSHDWSISIKAQALSPSIEGFKGYRLETVGSNSGKHIFRISMGYDPGEQIINNCLSEAAEPPHALQLNIYMHFDHEFELSFVVDRNANKLEASDVFFGHSWPAYSDVQDRVLISQLDDRTSAGDIEIHSLGLKCDVPSKTAELSLKATLNAVDSFEKYSDDATELVQFDIDLVGEFYWTRPYTL